MKITVKKENYSKPGNFICIAEFIDTYNAGLFIEKLMDAAEETGKDRYLIDIEFPETPFSELNEEVPY